MDKRIWNMYKNIENSESEIYVVVNDLLINKENEQI